MSHRDIEDMLAERGIIVARESVRLWCNKFDQRQARGESAAKMAFAEVVDGKYRFMKAQGVEPVCLACHGANIKPEVEAALKEKYPGDMARGYMLGQIRGAFSLSRDL